MKITVLTFFPEIFKSYFENLAPFKRGISRGLLEIEVLQIRDFTKNKHNRCDDTPYGGGAGLVLFCQPLYDAIKSIGGEPKIVFSSPVGKVFDQKMAKSFSEEKHIVFVAGRYEGYDNRIFELTGAERVSVGDYVLTGGEAPVLTMIDATIRHIKGVLESFESLYEESFNEGLLEYDHYTKPSVYLNLKVPDVLLCGHHKKIEEERKAQAVRNTYDFRPDLIKKRSLSYKELDYLKEYVKEKYSGKDK